MVRQSTTQSHSFKLSTVEFENINASESASMQSIHSKIIMIRCESQKCELLLSLGAEVFLRQHDQVWNSVHRRE